jgi:hypothetical protein
MDEMAVTGQMKQNHQPHPEKFLAQLTASLFK